MAMTTNKTTTALAVSVALTTGLALPPMIASADPNPFVSVELSGGYMQLAEGNCGGNMKHEAKKMGEGRCGEKMDEGRCGEKMGEGKCGEKMGEGKCGENMKHKMDKKMSEGKCGEGKCGTNK